MPNSSIPFRDTHYFSDLICNYLQQSTELKEFYHLYPELDNFEKQILEKSISYPNEFRSILTQNLRSQYNGIRLSELSEINISLLNNSDTYTVVTGHQLNLFTGPLYFFYKIISTINLCKQLKKRYPTKDFVPIYWMATEDHDFEEINFFNFNGKKVQWNRKASGPVGNLDLNGLNDVYDVFASQLINSDNADDLKSMFKSAYLDQDDLASAMRFLVNELFKDQGLLILDGDDKQLKKLFLPLMQKEITENISFKEVEKTNKKLNNLSTNYNIQVNPREINLFYIKEGLRERIVEIESYFYVNGTDIKWTKDDLMSELTEFPERFSPNVIMRPVFQEFILPNLCYIGGGGELAYWLQLKSTFKAYDVSFPLLLLRNSAVLIRKAHFKKLEKLGVKVADLFLSKSDLKTKITKQVSEIKIDFSDQKHFLKEQFKDLYKLAEKTDASFIGAVAAQEKKQLKGLQHLEKRLLKAQKRKLSDYLERVMEIQSIYFPNQSLQERTANFSEFYLEFGDSIKDLLLNNLDPLKQEFLILEV